MPAKQRDIIVSLQIETHKLRMLTSLHMHDALGPPMFLSYSTAEERRPAGRRERERESGESALMKATLPLRLTLL